MFSAFKAAFQISCLATFTFRSYFKAQLHPDISIKTRRRYRLCWDLGGAIRRAFGSNSNFILPGFVKVLDAQKKDPISYSVNLSLLTSKTKLNSVSLVRKQTIKAETPPVDGEVNANFCG
jgi:hypothetical protein